MAIERIDTELCVGCGVCLNSCCMDVVRIDDFLIDKEEIPPCRAACPAGVNMRGYIYLLKQGRIEEAMEMIREALPLPTVTGRVCFHPCENECARKEVDEAMNINALERYVADQYLKKKAKPVPQLYVRKVAIAGSGPAGLAAAYELVKMGYPVTVFELQPVFGGMLRLGIPEFRLPKDVLDAQINYIKDMGVEFIANTAIGKDISLDDLKKKGFEAVFLSLGAQLSSKLNIEGMELDDVYWGLDFLKAVNLKQPPKLKKRVLVIGGGNVAIDVALTALRLGAKEVELICLESRDEMPAYKEEIQQALDEGVKINAGYGPKKVCGDKGKVTGVELVRCVSVFDKKGKFCPAYDETATKSIETDNVIFAIGQASDTSLFPKEVKSSTRGTIAVDPMTLETNVAGVLAGGDVVSGPASVVEAIAAGKRAAVSINRYLRGEDVGKGRDVEAKKVKEPPRDGVEKRPRQIMDLLPVDRRGGNFKEIKLGLSQEQAMVESQRCMSCGSKALIKYLGDCMTCYSCELDCPKKAIYVSPVSIPPYLITWG